MSERLGKYELLERIALGGMAEIFRARVAGPAGFEKELVVKRILPQFARDEGFVRMFHDEARLVARFSHPNIVAIYELGETGGDYFIAMEHVRGLTLGDLLDRAALLRVSIPLHYGARIVANAAAGLDYAHGFLGDDGRPLGLVHRDVSPDNVLVSFNGAVKLIDFGVAKAGTNRTQTESGIVKGKLCYMSPEQIRDEPLDGRSDLFSLGIVLYEVATGRRPFSEGSGLMTVSAILNEEPVPPRVQAPEIPIDLETIVLKALEKDRAERYASAREMQRDLERFVSEHARYVGDSDVGELCRRIARGEDQDVHWIEALHAEVRTLGPPRRRAPERLAEGQAGAGTSPPTGLAGLDERALERAARLGGVGVATGHLAHVTSPGAGTRYRYVSPAVRRRRRRIAVLGAVVAGLAAVAVALAWWVDRPRENAAAIDRIHVPGAAVALPAGGEGPAAVELSSVEAETPPPVDPIDEPDAEEEPDSASEPPPAEPAVRVAAAPPTEADATSDASGAAAVPVHDAGAGSGSSAPPPDAAAEPAEAPPTHTLILGQGILSVAANLEGAEVLVYGRRRGTTPYREAVFEGSREVEVRFQGAVEKRKVEVAYGGEHAVKVHFPIGRVAVQGVPAGVVCSLDGRDLYRHELSNVVVLAGKHVLSCDDPAQGKRETTLVVRSGARVTHAYGP